MSSFEEGNSSVHMLGQKTGHEFATSVAAAAYAVHALHLADTNFRNGKTSTKDRSRRVDDHLVPLPRSRSRTSEIEAKNTGQGSMKKPSFEATLAHKPSNIYSSSFRSKISTDAKIDTWERNEVEKIKKRFAKNRSRIQFWEEDKKTKAKIKLQKKKIELECKKERNRLQYQFKTEQINRIGTGARAEMEKKMAREETDVRERAKKMRMGRRANLFSLLLKC